MAYTRLIYGILDILVWASQNDYKYMRSTSVNKQKTEYIWTAEKDVKTWMNHASFNSSFQYCRGHSRRVLPHNENYLHEIKPSVNFCRYTDFTPRILHLIQIFKGFLMNFIALAAGFVTYKLKFHRKISLTNFPD